MITTVCWIPKGVCKNVPEIAEPPSKEEIEEILKSGVLERSGEDEDEDGEMDVDAPVEEDEVSQALAAAKALVDNEGNMSLSDPQNIVDGLDELDLDHYDEEEDGVQFSHARVRDGEWRTNTSERETCTTKKSKTERSTRKSTDRVWRENFDDDASRPTDVQDYRYTCSGHLKRHQTRHKDPEPQKGFVHKSLSRSHSYDSQSKGSISSSRNTMVPKKNKNKNK